jgi:hypothetical protein
VAKQRTTSDLFLGAIEQIARAFSEPRKQNTCEPSIQAIQAIRQKQEEHEERKRRISQKIANGSRISRNL